MARICKVCQCLWYKYSHSGWFWATRITLWMWNWKEAHMPTPGGWQELAVPCHWLQGLSLEFVALALLTLCVGWVFAGGALEMMFSSVSGFCPLDAKTTSPFSPKLQEKHLQTLPDVAWGTKSTSSSGSFCTDGRQQAFTTVFHYHP